MGMSLHYEGNSFKQAVSIKTGKEHEHVEITLNRPLRRDIRVLSVDEPIDWAELYR